MDRITIAEVVRNLDSILQLLDNAYWEASKVRHKDVFYDIISIVHLEINELAKLSVEDHSMAYEPITGNFRNSHAKLKLLQVNLNHWVTRTQTSKRLEEELSNVIALLNLVH